MAENLNNSTTPDVLSKMGGALRDPLLINIGREEWRKKFIRTLEYWSCDDNALSIYQFCKEYGFTKRMLEVWRGKYPDVEDAFIEVKDRIGLNRWMLAFMRKASETLFLKDIHNYHKEWLDINKYHADMKKVDEGENGIQVVYLKEAPKTGKVKPKPKKVRE